MVYVVTKEWYSRHSGKFLICREKDGRVDKVGKEDSTKAIIDMIL